MSVAELGKLSELIGIAFAEEQGRQGRNFQAELQKLHRLLPLIRLTLALQPGLEDLFYTLVWDAGDRFAAAVTIVRQGNDRSRWNIANVVTHPDYRGRGLARLLVEAALAHIRARGGRYVLLDVRADAEPAYRLYRKLGFLLLRVSTTLKGECRPSAAPGCPVDYAVRPLPDTDWRTRLAVHQRLASPAALAICPPTAEQFQSSPVARGLQGLSRWARQVRWQSWVIEAAAQPVGLLNCLMRRSGPQYAWAGVAPDHPAAVPCAIGHAIRSCGAARPGPMMIELVGEAQPPIDLLASLGFTPVEAMHRLGAWLD
jgi:GNAT superfamily N-acetyltransferase